MVSPVVLTVERKQPAPGPEQTGATGFRAAETGRAEVIPVCVPVPAALLTSYPRRRDRMASEVAGKKYGSGFKSEQSFVKTE